MEDTGNSENMLTVATIVIGIFTILNGLAVTAISIFVASVAYQQRRINQAKLKLDLFEKRYSIYSFARTFLSSTAAPPIAELNRISQFRRETQDALFLFDDDVPNYLEEIASEATEVTKLTLKYQEMPIGEERNAVIHQEADLASAFLNRVPELTKVFENYLKFSEWK